MPTRLLEPGQHGERLREIPILSEEFLIGRGADCDLRLHDTSISRHHCIIRKRDSEITAADLGSINGTYINGKRVLSQSELHTGDEIRVGDCRFVIDLGDDPAWAERFFQSDIDPVAVTSRMPPQEMVKKLNMGS